MTEQNDNSSLPLFLAITAVVIVTVAGGWFLLGKQQAIPIEPTEIPDLLPEPLANEDASVRGESTADFDTELRKARLAADADILAFPPEQSALFFYGRALAVEPEHPIAKAEFAAVLTRLSQVVSGHMLAQEFDDAFRLASLVARRAPGHPLVHETQQSLNEHADRLIEQAIQHAQAGNDEQVEAVVSLAERLPGRNKEYFSALRDSISEIQQSRIIAEQSRVQSAQQATASAEAAWLARFRGAIASGRLISPPGDSARDYLAADDAPADQIGQLQDELATAVVASCQDNIFANRLSDAESLLNAANELGNEKARMAGLRTALETAFVEAETSKVRMLAELVRLKIVPPRYPRRAQERGVDGWVEVMFTVTPTGETADIEVSRAEPETMFDDAAIDAVAQWTFQPLEFRGQLISQRVATRIGFRLE